LPLDGCLPADSGPALWLHLFEPGGAAGSATAECRHGRVERVERLGGGLWRIEYLPAQVEPARPGPAEEVCRARLGPAGGGWTAEARFTLCAEPAGRIEIQAEPDSLLAGVGQRASLRILALDPLGRPWPGQPLSISVNVGQASAIEELGGGVYRANYEPPDDPYPQVALIMVANPRGARLDRVAVGRAVIPITARIELPGRTEPGTRVQMSVAGRTFGPVSAERSGDFKLPILVPPGFGQGLAISIDRVGNRRQRSVDLYLPETNQLGLWAHPLHLLADGRSRAVLLVTTIDRYGHPADLGEVRLRAESGQVSGLRRLARGLAVASYTAPERRGTGSDRIEVRFPGGGQKSQAAVQISLSPGPAARLELTAPEALAADGRTLGELGLLVTDGQGQPAAGKRVEFLTSLGEIVDPSERSPGVHVAGLRVGREPAGWLARVEARVADPPGERPGRILVGEDGLRSDPDSGLVLEAVLVDLAGAPVAGAALILETQAGSSGPVLTDGVGRARFPLAPRAGATPETLEFRTADGQVRTRVHRVDSTQGEARLLPLGLAAVLPLAAPLRAWRNVRLHPPVPWSLTLRVEPPGADGARRVRVSVSASQGEPVLGAPPALEASAGRLEPLVNTASGEYGTRWFPPAPGWGKAWLTASELGSGVGAVQEILEASPAGGGS
jgi:hypothetical protein